MIQAIQHYKRAYSGTDLKYQGKTYANVIEEMAHVYTVLDIARIYHDIEGAEIQYYQQKLMDRYINHPTDGHHVD